MVLDSPFKLATRNAIIFPPADFGCRIDSLIGFERDSHEQSGGSRRVFLDWF
jgi:hypothetical protein